MHIPGTPVSDPVRDAFYSSDIGDRSLNSLPDYSSEIHSPPRYITSLGSPVTTEDLVRYLRILSAFDRMFTRILERPLHLRVIGDQPEECKLERLCPFCLDEASKLGLFMELSEQRFVLWQERYIASGKRALPPLDVLFMWMTYLSSPVSYADDVSLLGATHPARLYPDLPLDEINCAISPDTLEYDPPGANEWKLYTGQPFTPEEYLETSTTASLACPACSTTFSHPLLLPSGAGFAQQDFHCKCPFCDLDITREVLGVGRFSRRVANMYQVTSNLLGATVVRGDTGLSRLLESLLDPSSDPVENTAKLGGFWNWSRLGIFKTLYAHSKLQASEVHRLLGGYIGKGLTTVDLVPAGLRHAAFVRMLSELSWLEPQTWSLRSDTIARAIHRYEKFLSLHKHANRLFIPTIGIEIAWQAHMLSATSYRRYMIAHLGRVLNRFEAIEQSRLAAALEDTARTWEETFHVPYITSGQLVGPLPNKIHRFAVRLGIPSRMRNPAEGPINYNHPIIYSAENSDLSRPCERNSVTLLNDVSAVQRAKERQERYDRLRMEALMCARKGTVDHTLAARIRSVTPPFVEDPSHEWRRFGQNGYPLTKLYITGSGGFFNGKATDSERGIGIGLMG